MLCSLPSSLSSEIAYIWATKIQSQGILGPNQALSLLVCLEEVQKILKHGYKGHCCHLENSIESRAVENCRSECLASFYTSGGLAASGERGAKRAAFKPQGRHKTCRGREEGSPPGGWEPWSKDCPLASSEAEKVPFQNLYHGTHWLGTSGWMS